MVLENLVGKRFGRLVVTASAGYGESSGCSYRLWKCLCDCGNKHIARTGYLNFGMVRSCGCLQREHASRLGKKHVEERTTHGASRTPAYASWKNMLDRCYNTDARSYKNYGGRGIQVCERWMSFENFLADMGQPPTKLLQIERVDNDGDYCPNNCKWATIAEQARNRSNNIQVTYNGKTQCLKDWAQELGISYKFIWRRMKDGMSFIEAINTPKKHKQNLLKYQGKTKTLGEWCRQFDIEYTSALYRYRKGMPPDVVLFGIAKR